MSRQIEQIGKTKLYFSQYLPGSIIQLRINNAYAKVVGTRSSDRERDKISKIQLLEVARNFIEQWESYHDGVVDLGLIEAIDRDEIIIKSPQALYIQAYPYILKCNNCGRLMNFRSTNENRLRDSLGKIVDRQRYHYIPCPDQSCSGHMVQLGLASVHRCGSIHEVNLGYNIPEKAAIKYINEVAYTTSLWDLDSGQIVRELYQAKCPSCVNAYDEIGYVANRLFKASAGDTFYPQNIQYIALSERNSRLIHRLINNDPIQEDVVSGLLLCLINKIKVSVRTDEFESLLEGSGMNEEEVEAKRQELEVLRKNIEAMTSAGLDPKTTEEILSRLRRNEEELVDQLKCVTGAFPQIEEYISDLSLIRGLSNSRRNFEASLIYNDIKTYAFHDLIADIEDPYERNIEISKLERLKENYGIFDIQHVNDLSVVLSSIGFTREKSRPDNEEGTVPVRLNGYQELGIDGSRSDFNVYAMQASTEGLIIKLSAIKVLSWCRDNFNIVISDPTILQDEARAHAYLLETYEVLLMEPKQILSFSAEHGLHETAPFHLIHSIAHALIATAKQHSGYEENNLVEYLLPGNLGFIIYVSSVKNYTAGGLSNLFKYYLTNWLDDASLYAFNCMMDPVCSEEGASCSSCLQQAISCELFNQGLSRSYMHGGVVEKDVLNLENGFWTQTNG